MKYSIIYAVLRPEIAEKISVGIIIVDGKDIDIKYSKNKLSALKGLFSPAEHKFVYRVISSLKKNGSINSEASINYLSRYSNNLIALSPLTSIDIEASDKNKERLYRNYVYDASRFCTN